MLDVLIVDDLDFKLIQNCIEQNGSILNGNCKISFTPFATKIPAAKSKYHNDNEIALEIIKKSKNIDLAFLDISFPDEENKKEHSKCLKTMIDLLSKTHPHCKVVIMSYQQSRPVPIYDYSIADGKYLSISKIYNQVELEHYNAVFKKALWDRLLFLMNECTEKQKGTIINWLSGNNPIEAKFKIGKRFFTAKSLFANYYYKNKLNAKAALADCLNSIIDKPIYSEKEWNKGTTIYKYGMKDYFYQYYLYFSNSNEYSLNVIIERAKEGIEILVKEIISESSSLKTKSFFNRIIKHKIRTPLKLKKHADGKIPNSDMLKFIDMLSNRLLCLGMYFGANLTCTSINELLQKNSYANNKDINKHFGFYLNIPLKDQLSSDSDKIIGDYEDGDKKRNDLKKSEYKNNELKLFNPYERQYEEVYNQLANYEKEFIKNICTFAIALNPLGNLKVHLEYINQNVCNL